MNRFSGLVLILIGMIGGWYVGRPPAPAAVEFVPPAVAWRHYLAEVELAKRCDGDIGPHPLLITALLGGAATWLLAAASRRPARTLAVAFLFVE